MSGYARINIDQRTNLMGCRKQRKRRRKQASKAKQRRRKSFREWFNGLSTTRGVEAPRAIEGHEERHSAYDPARERGVGTRWERPVRESPSADVKSGMTSCSPLTCQTSKHLEAHVTLGAMVRRADGPETWSSRVGRSPCQKQAGQRGTSVRG